MRFLADGRKKIVRLPEAPENINAVTEDEVAAGVDYSSVILSSDFDLGFAASDSLDEKSLDVLGNATSPGNSNFQGGISILREYDPTTGESLPASLAEQLFALVASKGGTHHFVIRHSGKLSTEDIVEGDEIIYVEVVNDLPQSSPLDGNIKNRVEFFPQRYSDGFKPVVAGTP